jgi:coenzyme F420-0:L-glutamate ligase / coenzyme F420-1:gamma-L-glutamate ligase
VDFETALLSRRSIRRYTGESIPAGVIDGLLQAAMWAPSAHGRQPWRWVVVTEPEAKERLARAMGARLRADRLAEGDPPEPVEAALARSYGRLTAAPALVVACSTLAGLDFAPGSRPWQAEHAMAMQSVAAAVENLLLAAQAAGLGACWICAPLYCPEAVREALALPADWEAQALVTLGYAAETKAPSVRLPMDQVVIYR